MVANVISWILRTFSSCTTARSGYRAYTVVMHIQPMKSTHSTVSAVSGRRLGSREMSTPSSVAMPTHSANGKSYANPKLRRCGFM